MVMPYGSAFSKVHTLQRLSQHQLFLQQRILQQFLNKQPSRLVKNMYSENRAHFESEKEAIHLILTGIGDEIYSTVDACQTAQEMWEAIERLQQVNELRAERMAKNANPFAFVSTVQTLQDPYYQSSKPHKSYTPTSKASLSTRSHATTRYKGKEIANQSHHHRDHLINYVAKIQEVLNADSGTNSKPLEQVQYDTGYNMFANEIQHSEQSESISNTCVVKTSDSNVILDSPDMCNNDIQNDQNAVECDDERVALANLIANLKLDVDENKKIQKQLKKENASLTQELKELNLLMQRLIEFERYKAFNDRIVIYDKLECKLNETLGLLAQKDIDIKEGLKLKAYEILVIQEKHDELVKQILLTKSHYEGLVKEKTKVITDLKLKEEKDIDKMISIENQLKFLNEIVYKRSQLIQTIHMLAPKCPTFNGRPTFANPMYLKKAQNEKPCLYEIPHDQSDPANNINHLRELVDQAWVKHSKDHFRAPTAKDMEILIKTCLMPLALKTQNDSFEFVHELKKEMHVDLKYVESLENEIDELESDKAEFSNMYDMLLQECVSNDVMCSYFHSLSELDAHAEFQCLYDHKVKECECLA
ncbi:hypothetical protein Tco_1571097 [Tanacetum coccineum]